MQRFACHLPSKINTNTTIPCRYGGKIDSPYDGFELVFEDDEGTFEESDLQGISEKNRLVRIVKEVGDIACMRPY